MRKERKEKGKGFPYSLKGVWVIQNLSKKFSTREAVIAFLFYSKKLFFSAGSVLGTSPGPAQSILKSQESKMLFKLSFVRDVLQFRPNLFINLFINQHILTQVFNFKNLHIFIFINFERINS